MTFLSELNSDIVETQKSLNDLQSSLSIVLQDSKKWTIASRFLSGTGLWSIQNRLRAVVSVMAEYRRGQAIQLEQQEKNMKLVQNLTNRTEKLTEAEKALNDSAFGPRLGITRKLKNLQKDQAKAQVELNKMMNNAAPQSALVAKTLQLSKITEQLEEQREILQNTEAPLEEIQTIANYYGVGKKEARELVEGRIKAMRRIATAQDIKLSGGPSGRTAAFDMERLRQQIEEQKDILENPASTNAQKLAAKLMKKSLERDLIRNGLLLLQSDFVKKTGNLMKGIWKNGKMILTMVGKFFVMLPFIIAIVAVLFQVIRPMIGWISGIFGKFMEWTDSVSQKQEEIFGEGSAFMLALQSIYEIWQGLTNGELGFMERIELIIGGLGKLAFSIVFGAIKFMLIVGGAAIALLFGALFGFLFGQVDSGLSAGQKLLGLVKNIILVFLAYKMIWTIWSAYMASGGWAVPFLYLLGILLASAIPGFADGGVSSGGLAIVGERGPEMVHLPKNSRVVSNQQSNNILSSGTTNNINVSVEGRVGASDQEIRQIARKVGEQINRELNRTTSTRVRM